MALGIVLFHQKQHAQAIEQFREVIRLDPKFPMIYQNLGQSLWIHGDLDAALAAYRTALERDPDSENIKRDLAGLLNDIGNRHRSQGELNAAITAYQEAAALNPSDPAAHFNLGNVWRYDRKDQRRAVAAYETAIRLDPKQAVYHANLALARLDLGEFARGLEAAEQAVKLAPNVALYRNILGWARYLNGDSSGAIPEYEEAIRLDPKLATPHNNLGLIWMANGDTVRAAAAFRRAAELSPTWDIPHANLGDLYLRAGDAEQAIVETREAIRLNPNMARHVTLLARALAAHGEYHAATDELTRAITRHPEWETDPNNACRFYRAVFAVRAGLGHGKDPVPLDQRAELRRRALQWLKADCEARRRAYPPDKYRYQMRMLMNEPHLACVRHPFFLTALPPEEAAEWLAFWDEVRQARDANRQPPDHPGAR
jgi:tetratricopeptide (TPR) repeat protein